MRELRGVATLHQLRFEVGFSVVELVRAGFSPEKLRSQAGALPEDFFFAYLTESASSARSGDSGDSEQERSDSNSNSDDDDDGNDDDDDDDDDDDIASVLQINHPCATVPPQKLI